MTRDHGPCLKCEKPVLNKTGVCIECSKIECRTCKKIFQMKVLNDTECTDCKRFRSLKARRAANDH